MQLSQLMENMWVDYIKINPEAKRVFDSFVAEGEKVINDHIALRTFDHPRLGIESLAKHFKSLGYIEKNEYFFIEKKLYAKHYEHPDETQPKIFISELQLAKVSPFIREEVEKMVSQIPEAMIQRVDFAMCGRPWKMSHTTYQALAKESEYASWVAAYGFRPNHFTVLINALKKWTQIEDLNVWLKAKGFVLNSSGGEIKGTPTDYLEQSSTMAAEIDVEFSDGIFKIPGCYYEFAKRYPLESGKLYSGFVAKSADKIFESTNKK